MSSFFKTNPVLRGYEDRFNDKPGKLSKKVHLEDTRPVVYPPRRIPIALIEPVQEELTEMEEDGVIVKKENTTLGYIYAND